MKRNLKKLFQNEFVKKAERKKYTEKFYKASQIRITSPLRAEQGGCIFFTYMLYELGAWLFYVM